VGKLGGILALMGGVPMAISTPERLRADRSLRVSSHLRGLPKVSGAKRPMGILGAIVIA
jgi:hypothetical protein